MFSLIAARDCYSRSTGQRHSFLEHSTKSTISNLQPLEITIPNFPAAAFPKGTDDILEQQQQKFLQSSLLLLACESSHPQIYRDLFDPEKAAINVVVEDSHAIKELFL